MITMSQSTAKTAILTGTAPASLTVNGPLDLGG